MDFKEYIYPLCIILSIIIPFIISIINFKIKKIKIDKLIMLYTLLIVSTLFLSVGVHILMFSSIGLSSIGGAIGAIGSIIIYKLIDKNSSNYIENNMIVMIPLMYSIGKIGCSFAGCCYGMKYNGLFNINYNNGLGSLFPIQIVESMVFFIIYLIMQIRLYKSKNVIFSTIILSIISKFLLDFLRYRDNFILSNNQIMCIIILMITIIIYRIKRGENNEMFKM